jgi:hypothetical protein
MPFPTFSTMSTMNGMAPGVDADGCIPAIAYKVPIKTVTAAAYTCTRGDSGTHFTNQGTATNQVFTLPAVATSAGCEYWFSHDGTTYTLTVTAPAGTLVAFNNIGATSVALATAVKMIGNTIHVYCDGTLWHSSALFSKVVAGGTIITVS